MAKPKFSKDNMIENSDGEDSVRLLNVFKVKTLIAKQSSVQQTLENTQSFVLLVQLR